MKKLEKIEDIISRMALKSQVLAISLILILWKFFIPKKIQLKLQHLYKNLENKNQQLKQGIQNTSASVKKNISTKTKYFVDSTKEKKEKILTSVNKFQKYANNEVSYKSFTPKRIITFFSLLLLPLWKKLMNWVGSISPQNFALGFTFSSVTFISVFGIYKNTQAIHQKGSQANREIASEVENATSISFRPGYHRLYEKHLSINQFALPGYTTDQKRVFKKLMVDFTIVTSNRYIKNYFSENEGLIKDKLYSRIEAIELSFPVETEEGKKIIKDKIQAEINNLINEWGIKGDTTEIYITSILAV